MYSVRIRPQKTRWADEVSAIAVDRAAFDARCVIGGRPMTDRRYVRAFGRCLGCFSLYLRREGNNVES
jgi:hypothetical protein